MIRKPNHSFSFLMEFLIVLFFFAVSAMICVRIFSSSVQINRTANATKEALEIAQNYIETVDSVECGSSELENGYTMEIEYTEEEYPHYVLNMYKENTKLLSLDFFRGNVNEKD